MISYLSSSGKSIPRLYGLPKVHKEGVPVRPILSMIDTPTHHTAKWLAQVLKPVSDFYKHFSVKDTFQFIDVIKDVDITDKTMLSFDVKSLFTQVPVSETIQIILDTIRDQDLPCCLSLTTLEELLRLCTEDVQFLCNGTFYRQVDGVAMGSCLGPIFAEIFMGFLEKKISDVIYAKGVHYCRYVDDGFLIVDNNENVNNLLSLFNNLHANITFTVEFEKCGKLPFLDVLLQRNSDGSIGRSVYRKPTWTGLYTNFDSFVPFSYKVNLVRTLVNRAQRICSDVETFRAELRKLEEILCANNYPLSFVKKYISLFSTKERERQFGPDKKRLFLKLPFLGDGAASTFKKCFSRTLSCFPGGQLALVFTTRSVPISSPKDRLPVLSSHNVVYKYTCTCGCNYIGRTSRRLSERISEHVPRWLATAVRRPPRSTRPPDSAITRHLQNCEADPTAAHEHFSVMHRSGNVFKLQALEAISIKFYQPDLCIQKDHVMTLQLPW